MCFVIIIIIIVIIIIIIIVIIIIIIIVIIIIIIIIIILLLLLLLLLLLCMTKKIKWANRPALFTLSLHTWRTSKVDPYNFLHKHAVLRGPTQLYINPFLSST